MENFLIYDILDESQKYLKLNFKYFLAEIDQFEIQFSNFEWFQPVLKDFLFIHFTFSKKCLKYQQCPRSYPKDFVKKSKKL